MIGNLIVISSPSGGGKGTLIKEVLKTVPDIGYSVSYTTRPMRAREENGREYFFVTPGEFEKLRAAGEFLEFAKVHNNFYGTSSMQVEKITSSGVDCLLEIDVQGARQVLERLPTAVSIFILPPSFDVLRRRLESRATEDPEDFSLRLRNAFDEIREVSNFEYAVINDDLPEAAERLRSVILAERQKRNRQMDDIQVILNNFDVSKPIIAGESTK